MEWMVTVREKAAGTALEVSAALVGKDVLLCVQGGASHLGWVVQSLPRPSLSGDGTISATSSVLNCLGHKDETICRRIAEQVCAALGRAVICVGGFHVDGITENEIREVIAVSDQVGIRLARELAGRV